MRDSKQIDFDLDLTITGDGSSLWASEESKGEWQITKGTLCGVAIGEEGYPAGIWELQQFGPKTLWSHYTDDQIGKEVQEKLLLIVKEKIENAIEQPVSVRAIGWSEQGMQPTKGWSFDVCLEKAKET